MEVTDEVLESRQSVVFDQAENACIQSRLISTPRFVRACLEILLGPGLIN